MEIENSPAIEHTNVYLSTIHAHKHSVQSTQDLQRTHSIEKPQPSSSLMKPKFNKFINNFLVKDKFFDHHESFIKPVSTRRIDFLKSQLMPPSNLFKHTQVLECIQSPSGRSTALTQSCVEAKRTGKSRLSSPQKSIAANSTKKSDILDDETFAMPKQIPSMLESLQMTPLSSYSLKKNKRVNSRSMIHVPEFQQTSTNRFYKNDSQQKFLTKLNNANQSYQPDLKNKKYSSLADILIQSKQFSKKDLIRDAHQKFSPTSHKISSFTETKRNTSVLITPQLPLIESKEQHTTSNNCQSNNNIPIAKDIQKYQREESLDLLIQKRPNSIHFIPPNTSQPAEITHKQNKSLDQKHVLASKLFQEMNLQNKHPAHLKNLSQLPNQIHLLNEELSKISKVYKINQPPQTVSLKVSNSSLKIPHLGSSSLIQQTPIANTYQAFYNQVCGYINEFQSSITQKKPLNYQTGLTPAAQAHGHICFQNQRNSVSGIDVMNLRKNRGSQSIIHGTVNPKPQTNQNVSQMEQYKAQMIETLLMNLNENFSFLVKMKKESKSVVKALLKIQGLNDMKEILFDEGTQRLKKKIDFRLGFIQEAQKIILWKSASKQSQEESQRIPVNTNFGTQTIPIDENLYEYIENKLQMSERQKRGGLEKYIADIKEMKKVQNEKTSISKKDINEFLKLEKSINSDLLSGMYQKRGQLVKRMEDYERLKGPFPFVGQLVRLKSQQIDQEQELLKEIPLS